MYGGLLLLRGRDNSMTRRHDAPQLTPRLWPGLVGLVGFYLACCLTAGADSSARAEITGRMGHIAFETFGRDDSITHVELLPYATADEHALFGDFRLFTSNDGLLGGNFGVGYRYCLPDSDRFLGGSVWYDVDDTTGKLFNQIGLSLETCGARWDARTNLYFPLGGDEKDFAFTVENQHFVGNEIVFDGARTFGEAMEGFDVELGALLPSEIAKNHDIRATAGYYFFAGSVVDDINGFKLRGEGNISDSVSMRIELTDDRTFGTNITLGVAIAFPGGAKRKADGEVVACLRPDRFVERNYNIIVSKQTARQTDLTAINTETGEPYVVLHVSDAAGGANLGTVDNPFGTVAEAQATPGDFIFVHSGTVIDTPLVLHSGEQILGEGVHHTMSYAGYGTARVPTATGGSERPTLAAVTGTAVTLASDSRLSGFVIDSPTGYGILGNGVENSLVSDVDVVGAGLDGIFLQDCGSGNVFKNVNVAGSAGTGFHVDGQAPEITFSGTIENALGRALVVENTTGGSVDLSGATIHDVGGEGVLIDHTDGAVAVGDVTVRNSTTTGVDVQGGSGDVAFNNVTVENAAGVGVNVEDASGDVAFGSLNVAAGANTGLSVRNSGTLTIEDGAIAATGGSAVDVENTTVDVSLTSVSSNGAAVGLRLVDTPGSFVVLGDDEDGSGGLIQNATTGVLVVNAGSVTLKRLDLDANGVGVSAVNTDTFVLSHGRVTNSIGYAIDSHNTAALRLRDSLFENNGGSGSGTIRAYADALSDYDFEFTNNTITDASPAAVAIYTTGAGDGSSLALAFDENDVTTTLLGADGVNLAWKGTVVAEFADNQFTGSGGSNDGLDLTTSSTTELVKIVASGNSFAFSGGSDVGLRFTTLGPANLYAISNTVEFDAANGTGMDFTLAEAAYVWIQDNTIVDNVASGTGIRFSSIDGPSTVAINGNSIQLLNSGSIIDEGIIFSAVTDTVELSSYENNTVSGATTAFYAPANSTTGYIYVNGSAVQ